jgi:hypothetical protein
MRRPWCVAVAVAITVPLLGQAAPRASRAALEGWLAVDVSGPAPRVLYDVRTADGQLLGTETSVPVQVLAPIACAAGACRAGGPVDLGATLAAGAFVLHAGAARLPRGNRPAPVVDAPVQLLDRGGAVLAGGTATMSFTRVRSDPFAPGPARWWYVPVWVIYRFGEEVAPFPEVTSPPAPSGPWEIGGTYTGGTVLVDLQGCCRHVLTFDVSSPDARLTGTSTEQAAIPVQSLCPWPGCAAGAELPLGSAFLATIQGSGEAMVRGESLSPAYYSGGFRFTAGTLVLPATDVETLVLQAPFTAWSPIDVFTDGAARQGDRAYLWATGQFTGAGTATLRLTRTTLVVDGVARIAYLPRQLVYTFEP